MGKGPCLCGDPYCQRCFPGNDGGAMEAALDKLCQDLQTENVTVFEMGLMWSAGISAIKVHREITEKLIKEAVNDTKEGMALERDMFSRPRKEVSEPRRTKKQT
jgi:hypothetical protein